MGVFNNFIWDEKCKDEGKVFTFQNINIIYGRNYCGKTTLSKIFRSFETHSLPYKYENPSYKIELKDGSIIGSDNLDNFSEEVRVFNEDFIRENLHFISDPDDNIAPFAILGRGNELINEEIKTIQSVLGNSTDGEETGLYLKLKNKNQEKSSKENIRDSYSRTLIEQKTEKATGRVTGIKYNTLYSDPTYDKTKLERDISLVIKPEYTKLSSNQIKDYTNTIQEIKKENIIAEKDSFNCIFDEICNEATSLLSEKIEDRNKIKELIDNPELNTWVRSGVSLHKNIRNKCAFCDNNIEDERWIELNEHFDNDSEKLKEKIIYQIKKIEAEIKSTLPSLDIKKDEFYIQFHTDLEDIENGYKSKSVSYCNNLKLIINQLNTKQENITKCFDFERPENLVSEIQELIKKYNKIVKESDAYSEKLEHEKNNAKKKLILNDVFEFCKTIKYEERSKELEDIKSEIVKLEYEQKLIMEDIKEKTEEIQTKKKQLNDESLGAEMVNTFLKKHFGHNYLHLESVNDNDDEPKTHFELMRNGKKAYNMSEGERSIIAFSYFMAKLKDIKTDKKNPIIWIDDPISSLDNNHIFFVYSLMKSEISINGEKKNCTQLFISTHNVEFLRYLKRLHDDLSSGGNDKTKLHFFIILREVDHSFIGRMPRYMRDYATEFNFLFNTLYECARTNIINDNNFGYFYNFSNDARKFLEIFVYYKYPNCDSEKKKEEKFLGNKYNQIFTERLDNEYSHLRTLERSSLPVDVPEINNVSKLILKKIKESDKDQYDALVKSIGMENEPELDL